jgi:RNA polymerase sigma factor (sigma-70 family)
MTFEEYATELHKLRPYILNYIRNYGINYADRRDRVSEVTLGFLRKYKQYKNQTKAKTVKEWIRLCIHRVLVDSLRLVGVHIIRPKRHDKNTPKMFTESMSTTTNSEYPRFDLLYATPATFHFVDAKIDVEHLLKCLSKQQRLCVVYYYGLLGHHAKRMIDIGKELRISESRVSQQLQTARAKMKSYGCNRKLSAEVRRNSYQDVRII